MSISIEINESHIKDMIEFYVAKQKSISENIGKLQRDLKDINSLISQLKNAPELSPIGTPHHFFRTFSINHGAESYSSKWTWVKKISFAIEEANRPLTTREIVEIVTKYEPKTEDEIKSAISSVSSTLSVKSGKYEERKDFIKSFNESGEYEYDNWRENKDLLTKQSLNGKKFTIGDDLPF